MGNSKLHYVIESYITAHLCMQEDQAYSEPVV